MNAQMRTFRNTKVKKKKKFTSVVIYSFAV